MKERDFYKMTLDLMNKDISKKSNLLIEKINEIDLLRNQLISVGTLSEDQSVLSTPRSPKKRT